MRRTAAEPARRASAVPLCAALLWAIHPVCAEPVAWIAGRKELLWTLFALAGLLAWLRAIAPVGATSSPRGSRAAYAVSLGCCALACLSKPTAMCFPLLAACLERALQPRSASQVASSQASDVPQTEPSSSSGARHPLLAGVRRYVPFLLLAAGTGGVALYSQSHAAGYDPVSLFAAPWYARLLNAATALGMYVARSLVPVGIRLDYAGGGYETALGLGVCAAVLLLTWRLRRSACAWAVAGIVCAVLPTLGIFGKFGDQAYADRFWYLPLAILAFVLVRAAVLRLDARVRLLRAMGLVAVAACAVTTVRVVGTWRNDLTLFTRVLAFEPENGRALCQVAGENCARLGDLDAGIALFRRSEAVRPRFDTRAQLAYALARRGNPGDLDEVFRLGAEVMRDVTRDRKGMMLEALGRAAAETGRDADAIRFLEASVRAPARFYSPAAAKSLLHDLRGL